MTFLCGYLDCNWWNWCVFKMFMMMFIRYFFLTKTFVNIDIHAQRGKKFACLCSFSPLHLTTRTCWRNARSPEGLDHPRIRSFFIFTLLYFLYVCPIYLFFIFSRSFCLIPLLHVVSLYVYLLCLPLFCPIYLPYILGPTCLHKM